MRYIAPFILVCLILFAAFSGPVQAGDAIQGILAKYDSPVPWWNISAFAASHADFDVAGFLAVLQCESGLGTTGKSRTYNNPGNIVFSGWASEASDGFALRPWLLWQSGWFTSAGQCFGTYPSMYWGCRAAVRLFYDRGYNTLMREHQWYAFAVRWYGDKPGLDQYAANLVAAHARFVREGKEREVEYALSHGIPVVHSVDELLAWSQRTAHAVVVDVPDSLDD
jgi:hypothetical protein